MAFYTVMIPPPGSGGPRTEIEQARLFPETFSWSALLLTGLWLLFKRLWFATLLFVLVWAALIYAQNRFGFAAGALTAAYLLIGLYLGLEGQNLATRKLAGQGWRYADVVEARNLSEAEKRYFERALAQDTVPPRALPQASARPQPAGPLPVIGLFPEARGR